MVNKTSSYLPRLTLLAMVAATGLVVFPFITSGNTAGDAFLKIEGVDSEAAISEDTNVCDGVTCPDGSCAPTQAECGVEATISPDIYVDHDREVERTRAEHTESTESGRAEAQLVPSDDIERAAPDGQLGEILVTHTCPIHGYHLIIARPAGYSAGASERVIQVEKTNRFFNATWNEVENLISNYPPDELEYNQLPQNPGPGGERYCNRNGHMIPTDMNVYQVSLAHYNNYTGQTSIFADSNLEVAPLINVLHAYNQHRVFGDELPPTCNYGCLDGSSGVVPDENSWDDINFGEIDWGTSDPRNPANDLHDGIDPGVGGQGGSVVDTDHAERRVDPDLDTDQSQVEWQMRTEQNDEDIVDDDDIVFAQDYNSTRSNKRENEFFDPDDDAEDDESGVATVSAERLATIVNDPPTVRCGAVSARDGGGQLYCWGGGVRAAAIGEGDEDGNLATSTRVLRHLSVSGDEVRSWNEQERAEFARYRELVQERNAPEVLLAEVTGLVLENERVRELEVDEQETRMTYRAQLRLFGLIPMEREVTARATEVDAMEIDYPWYSFLARKPDTAAIESLFSALSSTIRTHGGGAGKVSL